MTTNKLMGTDLEFFTPHDKDAFLVFLSSSFMTLDHILDVQEIDFALASLSFDLVSKMDGCVCVFVYVCFGAYRKL